LKRPDWGAKIVCLDIGADAVEAVVGEIATAGGVAMSSVADVRNIDDLRAAVAAAVARFGRIDVLVNNAGTMPLAFLSDHAEALQAWNDCIDINFKGVINGTVAVYDQMISQGSGQIVNISSIYGNHPVVGSSVHGATKAAVNYFSNSVRHEPREDQGQRDQAGRSTRNRPDNPGCRTASWIAVLGGARAEHSTMREAAGPASTSPRPRP